MSKLRIVFSGINDQLEALRIEKDALQQAAARIDEINVEIDELRAVKQDIRARFPDPELVDATPVSAPVSTPDAEPPPNLVTISE